MKKFFVLFAFAFLFNSAFSQDMSDFLKSKEMVWYGIDFSKAKMVGPDFNDPNAIVDHYFVTWNNFFLSEPDKYNPEKYFIKDSVTMSLQEVANRNKVVDPDKLVIPAGQKAVLENADIEQIVNEFDFGTNTGYGALMVVEKFSKIEERAYIHVVIINLSNKTILKSELIKGKARGFGFRNYWAGAIHDVLKKCQSDFAIQQL